MLRFDQASERNFEQVTELFHNRSGRLLWISTPLEPTPWLDYKSVPEVLVDGYTFVQSV